MPIEGSTGDVDAVLRLGLIWGYLVWKEPITSGYRVQEWFLLVVYTFRWHALLAWLCNITKTPTCATSFSLHVPLPALKIKQIQPPLSYLSFLGTLVGPQVEY